MKDIYSNILRWAITAGLYEREAFVDKLTELLTDKMNADPESSQHIAEGILSALASLKDELLLRQMTGRSAAAENAATDGNRELADKMEQLNRTLEELNKTLNKKPL